MLLAVPMKRQLPPEARAGVGAAFVLLCLVLAVEVADGPRANYIGLMAAAPFLAAAFASWRQVLAVGIVATVLAIVFGVIDLMQPVSDQHRTLVVLINLAGVMLATCIGAAVGAIRARQMKKFNEMSRIAYVSQGAVLRPLGPKVGPLTIAARYISATDAADIGGDLYEALDTPYGVRMIIGDVRGKGIEAVRLASIVLGSFRHVAYERADLRAIVADLDRAVARSVGDEDFVTAALIEERGGTLTIVNCGHPAPLLLRRDEVITLDPPSNAPPLGFMPVVRPRVERLEPGDRLLLFTDGLTEARRDGQFFPTAERARQLLGHGTVADGLASLDSALSDWVRNRVDDDIALVVVEYAGTKANSPVPSWEIGGAGATTVG